VNGRGKSIVKLQTPFGGGKTHALIVIYHYIKHGNQIIKHLPDEIKSIDVKLVTINGTQLNPLEGKKHHKIEKFISNHEPFVLLLDEMVEYLNKAFGVPIRDSNLGTQTLSFLQELTEALSSSSKGILIVTIPTHKYEDFSTTKIKTIKQLNHILGRVDVTEGPFERRELYKLVTKR